MREFLSRFRFLITSLAVAVVASVLHLGVCLAPVHAAAEAHGPWAKLTQQVQKLESQLMDFHLQLRGTRTPDPRVVVVKIDEKSVQRFGRWPWPREVFARGLERLHQAHPAAIGLDVMFIDQDRSGNTATLRQAISALEGAGKSDPAVAEKLAPLAEDFRQQIENSGDAALASVFAQTPEVIQVVSAMGEQDDSPPSLRATWEREVAPFAISSISLRGPGARGGIVRALPLDVPLAYPFGSVQPPLASFVEKARHLAQIQTVADTDGVTRGVPLFTQATRPKGLLPSLGLETAAVALGATVEPIFDAGAGALDGARLMKDGKVLRTVPLPSTDFLALLDYTGPYGQFTAYSFSDVAEGKIPASALDGKAVLVGATLLGEFDQIVTPYQRLVPGVFSHATLLSNILSDTHLVRSSWMPYLEALFLLLIGVAFGFGLPRFGVTAKALIGLGVALAWFIAAQVAFDHGHLLATLLPCVGTALSAQGVILVGYLTSDREKGRLKGAFSHYLNPTVMEQMLAHPELLKLGGQKRDMTVLFSDIRGFTTLAERMSPEALVKFINSYLTPMTEIVLDEAGTLDKYIGDAVMAFWGAPLDQEDHALRACRAALRFVQKIEELKAQWRAQGLPEFDIGVGINSGPMVVGNMGSDVRFDYTVMGDAVNLASRLEGTNKDYGTRLMISESTWERVKGQVSARRLGAVRVKGKRKPVGIFELRGLQAAFGKDAEAIATFEAAVSAYTDQKFDEAMEGFRAALALWPEDGPSQRYLEEIEALKARPPGPGWDGVYVATTK